VLRVGLTGGIGSGKSTVSRRLAELGAVVIDSDVLAREVVEPGTPGHAAVVAAFGPGVLAPDGTLDRPALGAIVFADEHALEALNGIVHPLIRERAADQASAAADDAVLVQDVPLLVESGMGDSFDMVMVVDAPDDERVARLVRERGMTEEDARARMAVQASREERLAAADIVLDNSGTPEALLDEVDHLWPGLERLAAAHSLSDQPPTLEP
jgi:dephospho-CoA kinase